MEEKNYMVDHLIEKVLKCGQKGMPQKEMMAHLGMSLRNWNDLKKKNPAFADACEMASGLSMQFYLNHMRKRIEEGSDVLIKFALERLHGFNEKVEQEVTQKGTVEVSFASLKRKRAEDAD